MWCQKLAWVSPMRPRLPSDSKSRPTRHSMTSLRGGCLEEHPTVGPGGGWSGASPGHPPPSTLNDLPSILVAPCENILPLKIVLLKFFLNRFDVNRCVSATKMWCHSSQLSMSVKVLSPVLSLLRVYVSGSMTWSCVWNLCERVARDVDEV